ncbi:MAG: histidine phosphatase family protein [Comamonadaceae bacterium]|nr:histidine phosphatase family protein [Comamonadaceae bacterium]
MTCPPQLWLLRHAQPLVAPGVCYGQLDVPAEPSQTLHAALRFARSLPHPALVRHSPLQRCAQLAQALEVPTGQVHADPRLQEMHFGTWEGQAWSAIGKTAVDAWSQDLYGTAPGGGESLAAMLQRVQDALLDSWRHDSLHGTRDVVWVTHAGVVRCVLWLLRYGHAQPAARDWTLPAPAFGQCTAISWQTHTAALQALA